MQPLIKMGILDTVLFVVKDHVTSQVRSCFKRYLNHPEVKLAIKWSIMYFFDCIRSQNE